MNKKRTLFYASSGFKPSEAEQKMIANVDDLYGAFYEDFKKSKNAIAILSALVNRQPIWTMVDEMLRRSKENFCDETKMALEVCISGLLSSYVGVLNMLESYTTKESFKKVKDMLYNESATFRLLFELKYIFRPRKPVHLFAKGDLYYLNIPETISDHEVSEERYENAFKGLDDVCVDSLWHDYKRTQNRLVEYLILSTISEKQLRRFYNCVKEFEKKDDQLMIATQEGFFTFNENIKIDKTRDLLLVYEGIPISDRNKIIRLLNECD